MPERHGKRKTIYNRFANWSRAGHFARSFKALRVQAARDEPNLAAAMKCEELLRPSAAEGQATTESAMGVRSPPEDGPPTDGTRAPPLQPSARLRRSPISPMAASQTGTAHSEIMSWVGAKSLAPLPPPR